MSHATATIPATRHAYTVAELAAALRTSEKNVREMVKNGCPCVNLRMEPVTMPHARLRFDFDAVMRWLKSFATHA